MTRFLPLSAAALLAICVAALPAPEASSAPESTSWTGDTVHSFVLFRAKHLGTSWTYGRFDDFTVSAETDAAGSALTSVAFTVKAESVDTGTAKRDQHLRSPDFLSAKEFPEISFVSTKATPAADGSTEVTGDLTLHGVTRPLTAKVVKTGSGKGMSGEDLVGFETTFTINRQDFGVSALSGAVGDDIVLTVATELAKK